MVKRWIKNLKWLFNHPPTILTLIGETTQPCDYCGNEDNTWHYKSSNLCICHDCIKKAYDKILKP